MGDECERMHALPERGAAGTLDRLSGTRPLGFLRTDRE